MRHNKDILWKGLLEWVFDDLLRFVYPNAEEVFDMQKGFGFLDKELAELYPEPERKIDVRSVDKLVKVFRKGGGEEWILIHIEVQDKTKTKDRPIFPERMFHYFIRCFGRHWKPVAAIAIFTGPDGKQLPDKYEYQFMDTRLQYQYKSLRLLDYSDKELEESDNPFAWVVLAAKKMLLKGKDLDEKLLEGKLFIFRKLFENGVLEKRKLQAILIFLNNYVRFGKSKTSRTFKKEIDKITGKKNTMDIFEQVAEMRHEEGVQEGLEKGLQKGAQKNARVVVENLLRKYDMSQNEIASVANVSLSFVKKVKKELSAK
jgi:hypothetical protein